MIASDSINTLSSEATPGNPVFILDSNQLEAIITQAINKAVEPLNNEILILKSRLGGTINCQDRLESRVARLENIPIKPSEKKKIRLDKLDKLFLSRKNEPLTYAEIGKLLELGSRSEDGKRNSRRQAMTKFSKILVAMPDKYVTWDGKSQSGKMCKLNPDYYSHLRRLAEV